MFQIITMNIKGAFSKMVKSPLTSVHRVRDRSPNFSWRELKSKLSMQYSSIPFDSHTTQTFAHLQQGQDEILEKNFHSSA